MQAHGSAPRARAHQADGGCADGIAAAWLEETDAEPVALQTFVSTSTFGLPAGLKGAGVLFDVHTDALAGDGITPACDAP